MIFENQIAFVTDAVSRIGQASAIRLASAVYDLATPDSGYTTGHTLKGDGGVHIG